MRLTILPEEMRVDLSATEPAAEWKGLAAVVRPLDELEVAQWQDAFSKGLNESAVHLVRQQLVRVEGVTVGDGDAPFDVKNPAHVTALFAVSRNGPSAIKIIFTALLARTRLDEPSEQSLDSPSASDGTITSAA